MVDPGPIFRGGPTLEYTWFTEYRGDHFEAELAKYADMPACSPYYGGPEPTMTSHST